MNGTTPHHEAGATLYSPAEITQELAITLESMLDGYFSCDAQWRFVHINTSAERILGIHREDVIGKSHWEVFPQTLATRLEREYRLAAAGEVREFENFYAPWNRWFHNRCFPRQGGGMAVYFREITQQKQSENSATKMQFLLTEAQKIAHVGSFEYLADTRQTSWSEEEYRIYGLDPGDPSPDYDEMLRQHIHPEDAALLDRTFTTALNNCAVFELEHRIVRPDGEMRWVRSRAHPYYNEAGQLCRYIGTTLDITEQRHANEELRLSEERFRRFMDNNPAIAWVKTEEGRHVYLNKTYERTFGVNQVDFLGKTDFEVWPEQVAEEFRRNDQKILANDQALEVFEEAVDQSGKVTFWQNYKFPYRDAAGRRYVAGIGVDITERKAIQNRLERSEKQLRLALDAARMGVYQWNVATGEVVWSDAYRQIFGIPPNSPASYDSWLSALFPEDRELIDQQVQLALKTKTDVDIEYRILWPDGSMRWISGRGRFSYDPDGVPLRMEGVVTDITERKQVAERLRMSDLRYRMMFENMLNGFALCQLLYDEHGKADDFVYLEVNETFTQLTGLQKVVGKRVTEVIPGIKEQAPGLIETYARVAATGIPEKLEIHFTPLCTWLSISVYSTEPYHFIAIFENITERKEAENRIRQLNLDLERKVAERTTDLEQALVALQVSENRYRTVVEDQTEVISRYRPQDNTFTFINEKYCRFFGKSKEELIGQAWCPVAVDEDLPLIMDRISTLSLVNPVVTIENRVYDGTGTIRWMQFINHGIFDEMGQLIEIQSVGRDITERKHLEDQLWESKEKFRALVEATSECIWEMDTRGCFTYLSPKFEEITGYSAADFLGKTVLDLLPPDSEYRAGETMQGLFASPYFSIETAAVHRSGRLYMVEVSGIPIIDATGAIRGIRGITRDISERWRLTQSLRDSEERFRCLFEKHSAIMLLVNDSTGIIEDANFAAAQFHGYSRECMQGMELKQIACESKNEIASILHGIAHQELRQFIAQHHLANGTIRTVEVSATPIPYAGKMLNFAIIHDITRRIEIEKEREQYYRLFTTSADLMCIADMKAGYFKKINPAGIELLGYSEQELLERPYMDFVHADDRQKTLDEAAQQMRVGLTLNFENRYLRKDGTICWLSWRGHIDNEQKLTYATARDMTEHKRLVDALALREERFRKLFELHSAVMLLVDPANGKILDANRAASAFYGYSQTQLRSMSIEQISVLPREQIIQLMQEVQVRQLGRFDSSHRLFNGSIRFVEVHSTPIVYQDQHIVFSIIHDITDRIESERKRQRAEAYARKLIEVNLDPLVTIDALGKISDVNEASILATGCSREEMIGTDFSAYFTEPQKAEAGYQQVFATGMVRDYPLEMRHRDGHVTPVLYNATIFKDEHQEVTGVFAAARDITELKHAEEQLRLLNAELEHKVEERTHELQETQKQVLHAEKLSAIGMLAASIAHEFNNPLQGIMIILNGLRKWAALEDKEKELADAAIRECERMKNLIRGLQDFNRPSSGVKSPMDVHRELDSLILLQTNFFSKKTIEVERAYAADLPSIEVVPDQIKQVFLNLLTNACDACGSGTKKITVTTWREGERVAVSVADTGTGIAPENLERIFQPFFSTKDTVKGTGLGLSVSHGIVQAHGGEIRVESSLGKGAVFTVILPIHGAE